MENNSTRGSTRRSSQPFGQNFCIFQCCFVKNRVKQFVQFERINAHDSCFFIDHTLMEHVHGYFHHGSTGTFTVTCLQEPQFTFLNGKFHILHIFVVIFKFGLQRIQLLIDFGHSFFHGWIVCYSVLFGYTGQFSPTHGTFLGDLLRCTDTGHDIFALSIDEVFTDKLIFAGSGIA